VGHVSAIRLPRYSLCATGVCGLRLSSFSPTIRQSSQTASHRPNSPAKAKTIAVPRGRTTTSVRRSAHRDLPRNAADVPTAYKSEAWSRLGVDVDNDFKPLYVVSRDKRDQVRKLKDLMKGASELYLATDEDREGESIAWHLLEVLSPRYPGQSGCVSRDHTCRQSGRERLRGVDRRLGPR